MRCVSVCLGLKTLDEKICSCFHNFFMLQFEIIITSCDGYIMNETREFFHAHNFFMLQFE